jgi:hypothetical protein
LITPGISKISNTTIANSSGSGLYIKRGKVQLFNNILAYSVASSDCFAGSESLVTGTNNLIKNDSVSPNSCGTSVVTSDPVLGTLANNGGPTHTIALLAGSPAIDAGDDETCEETDQRGVERPQGAHCDIGAYEYHDTTPPTVVSVLRAGPESTGAASVDYVVTFSEPVTGVDTSAPFADFALYVTGSINGAAVTGVVDNGDQTSYTVTVGTGTGTGNLRLDVVDNNSIVDRSGIWLGGPFAGDGNYGGGESYTINKESPVDITIGGVLRGAYTLEGGESRVEQYLGVEGGPVVVKSKDGANIIASYLQFRRPGTTGGWTGMTQTMGFTDAQVSDSYVFPHYDYTDATRYNSLQLANFDSKDTEIIVKIGGVERGRFPVGVGGSQNVTFSGVAGGPVEVSSNNGAKIVVSLYELKKATTTAKWTGQTQMMGLPVSQLSDTYIIPRYNYTLQDLLPYVVFANASGQTTDITVTIGGVLRGTYTLTSGRSRVEQYLGVEGGPVVVKSKDGANIIASYLQFRRPGTTGGWTG